MTMPQEGTTKMFISKNALDEIVLASTMRQNKEQVELPDNHAEIVSFFKGIERDEKLERLKIVLEKKQLELAKEVISQYLGDSVFTKAQLKKANDSVKARGDEVKNHKKDPIAAAKLDALEIEKIVWPVLGE